MHTYRIAAWKSEYTRTYIDAKSAKDAEAIALASLRGERHDVNWQSFEDDCGVGDVELVK